MKKIVVLFLAFLIGTSYVNASDMNFVLCEYSDEYIAWQKLSAEEKEKVKMPEMCKSINNNNTLGSNNDYSMSTFSLKDNYVLGVRNQESSGSCWAFSSLASIESNLLKNNIQTDYLSVAHLELMTQNSLYTPSIVTFNRKFNTGGNFYDTEAYVLNNWGPIKENDLPLNTLFNIINNNYKIDKNTVENKKAIVDVDNIFTLNNEQGACSADSINTIKKYLVNYGALAAGIYFTYDTSDIKPIPSRNNTFDISGKFINKEYYYYDGSSYKDSANLSISANQPSNHAVTIIGWNDNIEVTSFTTNSKRKGAWLVKNSYGTKMDLELSPELTVSMNMGDEGYFYVSYDDINICTDIIGFYNTNLDVSDNAYYYDYLGVNTALTSVSNTNYLGTIFTKKSPKSEKIDKITFATYLSGVDYTVYYASNGALKNYEEIASGTTTHKGYISVVPNKELYVSDKYSIIIKFETDSITDDIIPVAMASNDASNPYYNYNLQKGVSFISYDGNIWGDLTEVKTSDNTTISSLASIRVYTSSDDSEVTTEIDTDDKVNDSASTQITNPNTPSENPTIGDSNPNDINNIENPQTGIINYISLIIILLVTLTIIYLKKKNKIFKI